MNNDSRTVDKEATIKNILKKCNGDKGVTVDMEEFNKRLTEPDEEQFLIEAAELVGANVKYID